MVLAVLMGLSGLAGGLESLTRRRRKRILRRLASEWGMTYAAHDRLRLTPKVAAGLPVAGAADVYVLDLIYGSDAGQYRYIFTVEFTTGVIRGKRRRVRVGTFCEPRDRSAEAAPQAVCLASEGLPWPQQYRQLARSDVATGSPDSESSIKPAPKQEIGKPVQ